MFYIVRSDAVSIIVMSQVDADNLIRMEKVKVDNTVWSFPVSGGKIDVPLISTDGKETFSLDIVRGTIKLTKATYQSRARRAIALVRLDLDGPPLRNPDGNEIPCPHLHLYREGFALKWASPPNNDAFPNVGDLSATLDDFMRYCNVTDAPIIQRGLL